MKLQVTNTPTLQLLSGPKLSCVETGSWMDALVPALKGVGEPGAVDFERIRPGTNAYIVRSYDGSALQFAFPAFFDCGIAADLPPGALPGLDGAAGELIEEIKRCSRDVKGLRPLGGFDTDRPQDHSANIEPVTFCRTSPGAGQRLWKADQDNVLCDGGIRLVLTGALPYPGIPTAQNKAKVSDAFSDLLDSVMVILSKADGTRLADAALLSADQKLIRRDLGKSGLVSFIGDGTLPVRVYTSHRGNFRIAGPKENVNIPFVCPEDLSPVELELPASGGEVTGLGIRKKEVFAVAGSNAEGKSTFLKTVMSGADDHLPGDGREYVITSGNVMTAEAGEGELSGTNISVFFSSLPPGVSGRPENVYGRGSGSMVMAARFQEALRRRASLIVIDEDRSATNLLVPNCMQSSGVTPLSVICRDRREVFGDSSIIFAAATMDILVAGADRIMEFRDHRPAGVDRDEFRSKLARHLESVIEELSCDVNRSRVQK